MDINALNAPLPQVPVQTTLDGWSARVPGGVLQLIFIPYLFAAFLLIILGVLVSGFALMALGKAGLLPVLVAGVMGFMGTGLGIRMVVSGVLQLIHAMQTTELTVVGDDLRIVRRLLMVPADSLQRARHQEALPPVPAALGAIVNQTRQT